MPIVWVAAILVGVVLMATRVAAQIKPGVTFGTTLKPTTRRMVDAAEYVFGQYGIVPVITSGTDGTHRANSLHYSGDALDFRRWDSDRAGVTQAVLTGLRYYLGDGYDVILEPDHFHIEYDPN
jgi:hypothetical protein